MLDHSILPEDLFVSQESGEGNTLIANLYFVQVQGAQFRQSKIIDFIEESFSAYAASGPADLSIEEKPQGRIIKENGELSDIFFKIIDSVQGMTDTCCVQVGASCYQDTELGWTNLRAAVKKILNPFAENIAYVTDSHFLGHSLVYKSNIKVDVTSGKLSKTLAEQACPLFSSQKTFNILQHAHHTGLVSILQVPTVKDRLSPIIFVVLCKENTRSSLFRANFVAQDGLYLSSIGYYLNANFQWSKLHTPEFHSEQDQIKLLALQTTNALEMLKDKPNFELTDELLHNLTSSLYQHQSRTHKLNRIQLSIEIQIENLNGRLLAITQLEKNNSTLLFLQQRMQIMHKETDTIIRRDEFIYKQAQITLDLIESNQNQVQTEQSSHLQLLLALTGIGLGFIQIFDNESAFGLLSALNLNHSLSEECEPWWAKFLIKAILSALVLVISWFFIHRRMYNRRVIGGQQF